MLAVATAIGIVMVGVGRGTSYAPTKEHTFEESYSNAGYTNGTSTSSPERWLRYRNDCNAARNQKFGHDQHTGQCLGGLSAQFAKEFFGLYDKFDVFMNGKGKISTPIQIQIANPSSKSDGLVLNRVTEEFCNKAMKHCTTNGKPGARHNIWWETDAIRNPAMKEAAAFFDKFANKPKKPQCPLPKECGSWDYWRFRCRDPEYCGCEFRAKREITLIARGMKLTRLCSHAPFAALLPARVGQTRTSSRTGTLACLAARAMMRAEQGRLELHFVCEKNKNSFVLYIQYCTVLESIKLAGRGPLSLSFSLSETLTTKRRNPLSSG